MGLKSSQIILVVAKSLKITTLIAFHSQLSQTMLLSLAFKFCHLDQYLCFQPYFLHSQCPSLASLFCSYTVYLWMTNRSLCSLHLSSLCLFKSRFFFFNIQLKCYYFHKFLWGKDLDSLFDPVSVSLSPITSFPFSPSEVC